MICIKDMAMLKRWALFVRLKLGKGATPAGNLQKWQTVRRNFGTLGKIVLPKLQ